MNDNNQSLFRENNFMKEANIDINNMRNIELIPYLLTNMNNIVGNNCNTEKDAAVTDNNSVFKQSKNSKAKIKRIRQIKRKNIQNRMVRKKLDETINIEKDKFYQQNMDKLKKCDCYYCNKLEGPFLINKDMQSYLFENYHGKYYHKLDVQKINGKKDNVFGESNIIEEYKK